MTVQGYFDSNLVSACALNGGPCTCRQKVHVQKHRTIPFHEFPDRYFENDYDVPLYFYFTGAKTTISRLTSQRVETGVKWSQDDLWKILNSVKRRYKVKTKRIKSWGNKDLGIAILEYWLCH